jgi:mobilome CxxCx(11)CxxC protein
MEGQDRVKVSQCKMDALSAKYLHERRLAKFRRFNSLVDYLAIAVPVLYLPARYLAKGTAESAFVEHMWEVLAAILLASVIFKMAYRWQERAEKHSRLLAENIALIGQVDYLLSNSQNPTPESIRWFTLIAEKLENDDRESFGIVKDREKKKAYREALKEVDPSSTETVCPRCHASPWDYKRGSCQLCGNTPRT